MTRFASGFRGLLTARSRTLGRKRLAGIVVASWVTFMAASGLSPCCDILAAVGPHGDSLCSTAANHDARHATGDHAPHSQCATIGAIDMAAPHAVPLLLAKLQLPDALWLPAAAMAPAPIRQSQAFHTSYPQPPPLSRLYLRTSRLLI